MAGEMVTLNVKSQKELVQSSTTGDWAVDAGMIGNMHMNAVGVPGTNAEGDGGHQSCRQRLGEQGVIMHFYTAGEQYSTQVVYWIYIPAPLPHATSPRHP